MFNSLFEYYLLFENSFFDSSLYKKKKCFIITEILELDFLCTHFFTKYF